MRNKSLTDFPMATSSGNGTTFATGITSKDCGAGEIETLTGYARGHAIWPNGVTSGFGYTYTDPYPYSGTC